MKRTIDNKFEGAIRLDGEGDSREIVGVAAVYYDGTERTEYKLWGNVIERIDRKAFRRALAEKHDVRGLKNHDSNLVLGRSKSGTLILEEKDDGLHYRITPSESSVYRDTQIELERGDIDGSSFQFIVTDEQITRDDDRDIVVRTVLDVTLIDVGPVTFPAYTATSSGVRAAQEEAERILEAVGAAEQMSRQDTRSQLAKYQAIAGLLEIGG